MCVSQYGCVFYDLIYILICFSVGMNPGKWPDKGPVFESEEDPTARFECGKVLLTSVHMLCRIYVSMLYSKCLFLHVCSVRPELGTAVSVCDWKTASFHPRLKSIM